MLYWSANVKLKLNNIIIIGARKGLIEKSGTNRHGPATVIGSDFKDTTEETWEG